MASNRPVYNPKRSRLKKGTRTFNSSGWWKFAMAALILIAVFFAVKAYRYSHNAASGTQVNDIPFSANRHYPDLEIAKYSDKSAAKKAFRKDYTGFTVSFNPENRTPDWVGWELLGEETEGPAPRAKKFWADEDIHHSSTPDDYRNSGYDKGHLCPAADQKWSYEAMNDCFVMTNMTPQTHALNAGAWNTLENKERLWAKRDSAIIIVAGPIYTENDKERIGYNGVRVPSAFFKVLLAPYVEKPRAIGFIYPNMEAPGNMQHYAMSVDDVEKETGLDFFSNLPDSIEDLVESRFSFTEWNKKP